MLCRMLLLLLQKCSDFYLNKLCTMPLQYIQDFNGATTAVIVPIEEWNKITEKYSDVEDLQQWQKNIIDQRLELYKKNPERVVPVEQFFEQMDKDEDEV